MSTTEMEVTMVEIMGEDAAEDVLYVSVISGTAALEENSSDDERETGSQDQNRWIFSVTNIQLIRALLSQYLTRLCCFLLICRLLPVLAS